MKKLIKLSISFLTIFSCTSLVFADGMVFEPISVDSKTTSSQYNTQSGSVKSLTEAQSANFQNALFQLDTAQVELRNKLVDLKTKYTDVDSQYKLVKEERKILSKEVKSLEKRIKNLDKTKENIRKNMQ